MVEMLRVQCLDRDSGVFPPFEYSVFDWRWAAEVREERRVYIQTAILCISQNPGRNEQAEGYSDDQVYWSRW